MVTRPTWAIVAVAIMAAAVAASACRVANSDHCANQDVSGHAFCREVSLAIPYCSPCVRNEFHGCVDYEDFACPGFDPEDNAATESTTGDSNQTGSTSSEASTSGGSTTAAG